MDQDFGAGLGQLWAESGDISEVEEGSLGDVFDVRCK